MDHADHADLSIELNFVPTQKEKKAIKRPLLTSSLPSWPLQLLEGKLHLLQLILFHWKTLKRIKSHPVGAMSKEGKPA